MKLKLGDVEEIVRGPDAPLPFREIDGNIVEEPDLVAQRAEAVEAFRRVMVRQLELTPRKSDVVLTLRDDFDPGSPGRPLEPIGHHFWQVPSGYPAVNQTR